jgi:hypothetical protein
MHFFITLLLLLALPPLVALTPCTMPTNLKECEGRCGDFVIACSLASGYNYVFNPHATWPWQAAAVSCNQSYWTCMAGCIVYAG